MYGDVKKPTKSPIEFSVSTSKGTFTFTIPVIPSVYWNYWGGGNIEIESSELGKVLSATNPTEGIPAIVLWFSASTSTKDETYRYKISIRTPASPKLFVYQDNGLTVKRAGAETNNYDEMSPYMPVADNEEFYLMYGFKKTYFIDCGSLSGVPLVNLSINSDNAPYLQYEIKPLEPHKYRIDFWVDRYENPLLYNVEARPYASDNTIIDADSGDKKVGITITLNSGDKEYSQKLTCIVLHKRFAVNLSVKNRDLVLSMWNPLQLYMNYTIKGLVNYSYWKTPHNVLWWIPEDKEYEDTKKMSDSFGTFIPSSEGNTVYPYFADYLNCENLTHGHVEGSWNPKKDSYDIGQGTDWSYFRFPYVEDCGCLILTYKKGKVKSSYINFQRSCFGVSNEFKSASPGLSCSLSNFNIDNFISVPANIDYQPLWSGKAEWFVQSGSTGWFGLLTPKSYDVLYEGIYYIRSTKYIELLESCDSSTGRAAAATMKELGLNDKEWQFWDDEYGPKPIMTGHEQNNPVISY